MPGPGAQGRRRFATALAWAAAIFALRAGDRPCLAQAGRARAEDRPALDVQDCPNGWADGLRRLLDIELGAGPDDAAAGALAVAVRCDGDLVDIEVAARDGAERTQRRMDLRTTASSVRARVLALAIAGLVRELALIARPHDGELVTADAESSEPREATSPRAAQPPRPPPQPPAAPPAAEQPAGAADVQLDLLAIAGNFAASGDLLWSGGARAHYLAHAPLRAAIDLQAGAYARETEFGSVRLLAGSLGARLGFMLQGGRLGLTVGGGQRLGIARASAATSDLRARDDAVVGAWTAPFAFVTFEAALGERLRAGIDGELGAVLLPLRGRVERGEDIAVDGLWAALGLTLGAQF